MALPLRLLRALGLAEGDSSRSIDGVLNLVGFNVGLQVLELGTLLPGGSELIRGLRCSVLEACTHNTLDGRRHRCQEIRCCLTGRAVEAEVDKVLSRGIGATKENLASLVQDYSLVEKIVCALRRLVNGDAGSGSKQLGLQAEGLAEFNSIGGIKTTGRVVPALKRSSRQCGLRDSDTLALTT